MKTFLGYLKRGGLVTVSDQVIRLSIGARTARSLVAHLRDFGAVTVSAQTAQSRGALKNTDSDPPSEVPQGKGGSATKERDWIDRLDITCKLAFGVIGTIWAVHTFAAQRDSLLFQLKTQDDTLSYQRKLSQAQFAATIIPSLSEDPALRRAMAIEMLSGVSPKHAVDFARLASAPAESLRPSDLDGLEKLEFEWLFSTYLADARKCQDYELYEQAAKQYIKAWNRLPGRYSIKSRDEPGSSNAENVIDWDSMSKAIESYANNDFRRATSQFSRAFGKVEYPY